MWLLLKKVFRYYLFFLTTKFIININCEDLDDLVYKIENEVNKTKNYKWRTDNSDIFTEKLTQNSTYLGHFDFIVVGAGSSGAVVAKRLSESYFRVLLLEAGVEKHELSDIPGLFSLFQHTNINWGYKSSPQNFICQGMINNQCPAPRAKILGGTSKINNIIYGRGNSYDQDSWRDFGISGWSWNETLPYFKKLENYQVIDGDPTYHGMDGPIHINYATPSHLLDNIFLSANAEIYKLTKDYNGEVQMAAAKLHMNKNMGRRDSSDRAYLGKYYKRYLKIETNAYVHRILFRNNQAIGVEYIKNNRINIRSFATKEIIISAGTFNTPQLLMLSGIGPKMELSKHNIPVLADLPVGKHLQDHVAFSGLNFESTLAITNSKRTLRNAVFDFLSAVGPLTSGGVNSATFLSTSGSKTYPDIELVLSASGRPLITLPDSLNKKQETIDALRIADFNSLDNLFQISVVLLHPKSRGVLTLKSRSPKDFPVIDFNSLSESDDVERIYKSLTFIKKLLKTNAFRDINVRLVKQVLPACKEFEYDSKEFWICSIRHLSIPAYHSTSTCIMGLKGASVVDNKLRVHGISGLRIADLSVAPKLNSGHTNALAMMIGEKTADIITNDYK